MTLTNLFICFGAWIFYWAGKLYDARKKHRQKFYAAAFLSDNAFSFVTSLLGATICFFVLPVYLNQQQNPFIAFLCGYCGASTLKFITKSILEK